MMRAILLSLAIIGLSACAATDQDAPADLIDDEISKDAGSETKVLEAIPEYEYTPVHFNLTSRDAVPSEADKERCTAAGGKVQRAGLLGAYHCVQTYPDAGKVCRDSSECIGMCRTQSSSAVGKPGTGTCQSVDVPFGCYALVTDGFVDGGMLCVD